MLDDIVDASALCQVQFDERERFLDEISRGRDRARGVALGHADRRNENWLLRRFRAFRGHERIKHLCGAPSESSVVGPDAGKGRLCRFAHHLVVVDSKHCDARGNVNLELAAGGQHVNCLEIRRAKDRGGLLKGLQEILERLRRPLPYDGRHPLAAERLGEAAEPLFGPVGARRRRNEGVRAESRLRQEIFRGEAPHGQVVVLEEREFRPVSGNGAERIVHHHDRNRAGDEPGDLRRNRAGTHDDAVDSAEQRRLEQRIVDFSRILQELDAPVVSLVYVVEYAGDAVASGDAVDGRDDEDLFHAEHYNTPVS